MEEVSQARQSRQTVAVIDVLSAHGEVLRSQSFTHWPISIGRSVHCDMVLNEAYMAPMQCLINASHGEAGKPVLELRALDQTNACHVQPMGGAKHAAQTLPADGLHLATQTLQALELRMGATHLRLRTSDMVLAPTQLLKHRLPHMPTALTHFGRWPLAVWAACSAVLFIASVVWELWLSNNPDATSQPLSLQTATTMIAMVLWAGFWAVLSKIFRRQANFVFHLFVVCSLGFLSLALLYAMHFAAFSFSWPLLGRIDSLVWIVATTALTYAHLRGVVAHAGRVLHGSVLTLGLLVLGIICWSNYQKTDSILSTPYHSYLYRPALRLAAPMTPEMMVVRLQSMQAELDRRTTVIEPGEDSGPNGAEE